MRKIQPKCHILFSRLPRHARDLILYTQVREYCRRSQPHSFVASPKPNRIFRQYKNYRMVIRLRHWCMTSQARSLMQAAYSRKPKNPE